MHIHLRIGGVFAKPSENATNTVVLGGWTANSPWTDEIAANNGFSAFEVIARENDNVFFVFKNTEKTQYTYLAEYYAQKYPGTTLEVCDKFTSTTGEEFIILRCNK